ncbi:MAG: sulfite exporter TauE/SafE family protein [Acetilactobacillus jinshanensis]
MVVLFLLGIYCAYFGAGSGIVYLALMAVVSTEPFKVYNSVRNVSMVGPAIASAVVYATQASVNWSVVVPLGLGMLVGGYLGPIIVRHVNEKHIKIFVVICGLILTVYLFMKAYL